MKFLLKFLFPILLIFFFNKKLTSIDYETAKEHFDNKEYAEAYQRYNECTNECTSGGKCNKEHFMCMLEIGRMLEQGLVEKDLSKEQRTNKAIFWYEYCSDKKSKKCAVKIATLKPRNKFIVFSNP